MNHQINRLLTRKPIVFLFCCIVIIVSCKKTIVENLLIPEPPTSELTQDEYNKLIYASGMASTTAESKRIDLSSTTKDSTIEGIKAKITRRRVKAWEVGGGNGGFPLFNPNASVIYPGSLLQGASLGNATPDEISVKRAAGTISIDINNGSTGTTVTVPSVSRSSVGAAMNKILASNTGKLPAAFNFSYENVQSKEQLAIALKANFNTTWGSVEGSLSLSTDRNYNRYIVKLDQTFYTMMFDAPTSYKSMFDSTVTPDDLKGYVRPNNPFTYISQVTYGRVYYMLIESTSRKDMLEAAVKGSFNVGLSSGSGSVKVDALQDMKDLKIKVMAMGGEVTSTIKTFGQTDIKELANMFAVSSDIKTGVPISYVVKNLVQNQIVSTQLNNEYDVVDVAFYDNMYSFPLFQYDAANATSVKRTSFPGSPNCVSYWKNSFDDASPLEPFATEHYANKLKAAGRGGNGPFDGTYAGKAIMGSMRDKTLPSVAFSGVETSVSSTDGKAYLIGNYLEMDGKKLEGTDYTIFLVVRSKYTGEGDWKYVMFSTDRSNDRNINWSPMIALTGTSIITSHGMIKRSTQHFTKANYVEAQVSNTDNWNVYAIRFSQKEGTTVYVNNNPGINVPGVNKAIGQFTSGALGYMSSNTFALDGIAAYDAHFDLGKTDTKIEVATFSAYGAAASPDVIQKEIKALRERYRL